METPSDQGKKAAHQAANELELTRSLDQGLKEIDSMITRMKKENQVKRRNSILTNMLHIMRDNGASERAIKKALPGLDEFSKFASRTEGPPTPRKPEHPQSPSTPTEELLGMLLSEVETQEVHWLWERRIPLGKITILDGDPGMGKSLLAIHLAACVSTGHPMPDGTPCKQGNVILIAPEDGAGDTLRPRLEAAGGDPSHVLLLNTVASLDARKMKVSDRPFSLAHDLEELENQINRTNTLLVILDPLMAVLGHNIDSSRDQDIREVFTPLAQLAERTNCTILIIRHLTKGASANALYRGAGSIGIIAAARTGLLVAPDPSDETTRILATTKNNLTKKSPNLSYQVVENATGIPYIQWLGENHYTTSTLLNGTTNLSLERQQILQALKDADSPLSPQEVVQLTGQTSNSVRLILSRMQEAGEIIRCHRGKYTSLNHPSLPQQDIHNIAKTTDTSDTLDTSDTSDTLDILDTNLTVPPPQERGM